MCAASVRRIPPTGVPSGGHWLAYPAFRGCVVKDAPWGHAQLQASVWAAVIARVAGKNPADVACAGLTGVALQVRQFVRAIGGGRAVGVVISLFAVHRDVAGTVVGPRIVRPAVRVAGIEHQNYS